MKNELYRHKRSDKIKWTLTAIAFVLLAVLMAGVCMQVFGKGKVQPSEWFKKAGTQTEQIASDKDGENEPNAMTSKVITTYAVELPGQTVKEAYLGGNSLPVKVKCGERELTCTFGSMTNIATWPLMQTIYQLTMTYLADGVETVATIGYRVELSIDLSQVSELGYENFNFVFPSSLYGWNVKNQTVEENTLKVIGEIWQGESTGSTAYSVGNRFSGTYVSCDAGLVSLPADPVKEGYNFAGWYYGTESEHGDSCVAYDGADIYANTDLHAHFNAKSYTIMLYPENGDAATSLTAEHFSHLTLTAPEREGYDFVGWALADGTIYDATQETVTGALSLHAKWAIKTYTVTFWAGGTSYATVTVGYGSTLAAATA